MEAENGGTWSLGKGSEVEVWNRKGSVMSRGRADSRWVRDLWRIEREENGFRQFWFSSVVKKVVGNRENTTFWNEPWVEGGLLRERFARLYSLSLDKEVLVADLVGWREGLREWKWRWRRVLFQWEINQLDELTSVVTQSGFKGEGRDSWVWKLDKVGVYSVQSAYKWLRASDSSGTCNIRFSE